MTIKKLNFLFIASFLFLACSIDKPIEDSKEITIDEAQNRIGQNCMLPENPLFLSVEYSVGTSPMQKNIIRNTHSGFVGLHCVTSIMANEETWIVDADIYNSYCQICVDEQKCCRSEVIEEEEDDIEKVEVIITIKIKK